jgi:hypothetical protein
VVIRVVAASQVHDMDGLVDKSPVAQGENEDGKNPVGNGVHLSRSHVVQVIQRHLKLAVSKQAQSNTPFPLERELQAVSFHIGKDVIPQQIIGMDGEQLDRKKTPRFQGEPVSTSRAHQSPLLKQGIILPPKSDTCRNEQKKNHEAKNTYPQSAMTKAT